MKSVQNNFDLLRVLLALMVMFYHIGVLANIEYLLIFSGDGAVKCFFVISGYLITRSYFKNKDLKTYVKSRFLRIYPLYFIVIMVSVLAGLFLTSSSIDDYLAGGTKYLVSNLLFLNFLQPSLPGVFNGQGYHDAINGSLWTIKIEVMFYISVPIIYGYLHKFVSKEKLTVIFYILSLGCFYFVSFLVDNYGVNNSLNNQLPSMMSYFMVGAFFNFIDISNPRYKKIIIAATPFSVLLLYFDYEFFEPIFIGVIVFFIAFCLPIMKVNNSIGDLSYGIYIWHFPVIQIMISMGEFSNQVLAIIKIVLIVLVLAYMSWHLLESKLLNNKKQVLHCIS
ncbi:TPA: acyltransferase family protein [Photobacterium damselae]